MPPSRKLPFTYAQFKTIYSKVPRLVVDLVIKNRQGVLMLLRKHPSWKGQWHLPGGTVYYKETIEQAIDRFAQEEVGLKVKMKRLLGHIEYHSEQKERGFGWTIGMVFLCEIESGTPEEGSDGETPTFFKEIPDNTVLEQKNFLRTHL